MNKTPFQNYLHSFSFQKTYWYTLAIDLLFALLLILAFASFNNYAQSRLIAVTGTANPEQFQQAMSTMNPEQFLAFAQQMKSYLTIFFTGFTALILLTWLGYSLDTALVWNLLTNQKFPLRRRYWRWNRLHLVVLLLTIGYVAIALLIKILSSLLFSLFTDNPTVLPVLNQLVSLLLLLLFFIFLFLIYYSFVRNYKVFESIAESFKLFKVHARQIWLAYLFIVGTAIAISLLYWLLNRQFLFTEQTALWIQLVLSLLFLAWLRAYLLQVVQEGG